MCDVKGQTVKQVAVMSYLCTMLSVWEHSKVEQNVRESSKMIGAIGSTYSARKEGIDQGYHLRVVTVEVITTLTYTDVKLGLYRQSTRGKYRLHR